MKLLYEDEGQTASASVQLANAGNSGKASKVYNTKPSPTYVGEGFCFLL